MFRPARVARGVAEYPAGAERAFFKAPSVPAACVEAGAAEVTAGRERE